MRKMRAEGYTYAEIAKKFGLSPSTVQKYVGDIKPNKRKSKSSGRKLGDDEIREIYRLYKLNYSTVEIAKYLGISRSTVFRYVKKIDSGEINVVDTEQ